MLEQITASAGSGKTYTLTRHFLRLLEKASPDARLPACAHAALGLPEYCLSGILAATFTNKAAAEMKARVIRDLKAMALGADRPPPGGHWTAGRAAFWVDAILRRYDALNIRTIDSLLTLLVRSSALSLDLPPDFTPVFNDEEYFAPLYDALLDTAARGDAAVCAALREACRGLLFHGNSKGFMAGTKIRRGLLDMVRFSLTAGGTGGRDGSAPFMSTALPTQEQLEAVKQHVETLYSDVREHARRMLAYLESEGLAAAKNFNEYLVHCAAAPRLQKSSAYTAKASLDGCLLKASQGAASPQAEKTFADFCRAAERCLRNAPPLLAALELGPFALLAAPLAADLARAQQEEGRVPASLLPGLARQVLHGDSGVSDAFCRMGNSLAYLLFDEFQDTSRDQWASISPLAVECLSKGGSLVYVGDVKQAIYGWRGGDAALFDELLSDQNLTVMLENPPTPQRLSTNWRSAESIVAHNNRVFGPLGSQATAQAVVAAMLPDDTPPALCGQAVRSLMHSYHKAEQAMPPPELKPAGPVGFVGLTRIHAESNDAVRDRVREKLCDLLASNILQRRQPGDIAVLVRRNEEAAMVAQWLTGLRIPVVTEHSFRLDAHPLIQRLAALLAFLDFPPDDTAFWGFISGEDCFLPAAGLEAPQLFDWLARCRAHSGATPLYRLFRQDFPLLWQRWIAPFHDQAGLMSAYDTIAEAIRHFALFERLPAHAPFLRRFMEVAHAAENKGHSSLSSFLEFWNDTGHEEKVPMPEGMNAVRILTIHKAKGLEFPVVIVPFHHHSALYDAPLTHTVIDGLPVLTRRTKHLGDEYYAAAIHTALEQLNLLYVAWTRPSEELHIFLTSSPFARRSSGIVKALEVLLADFSFVGDEYTAGIPMVKKAPASDPGPATATVLTPEHAGQPGLPGRAKQPSGPPMAEESNVGHSSWRPMAWLPRLKIFRNRLDELTFTERRRGLLAHACLEALHCTGAPEADAKRAVRHGMASFPLPMPDVDGIAREMRAMLTWYAALPETKAWLETGRAEQSIMDAGGSMHRVDLLVDEHPAGLLTVEYKTGQTSPDHALQVQRYLRLLHAASGRPVRGVLVYLDLRHCVQVSYEPVADDGGRV